jgi:methylated-DNA-protein-cysteine methyltransferase related protein
MASVREFYAQVYHLVRHVPPGRVTTYGTLARALGAPHWARQVGWALAALDNDDDVPWHRVVNARGGLSPRSYGSADLQRALLEDEGVRFDLQSRLDLDTYLWEPDLRE